MADDAYQQAISWLYSTQMFGIKPGLDNMRRLLTALGKPQDNLRFFHVAGTNGKGSTCAFLESILRTSGHKTGLFTSPHLISYTERMRINGAEIPKEDVANRIQILRRLVADWDPHPTFFELTTALALQWFADERCDMVVLETGMGGRLDATNVVVPLVSIVTPISFDHEQWLGDTLEKIAAEKAGIFKPGVAAISAPQHQAAAAALLRRAEELSICLTFIERPISELPLGLAGGHQQWNAALAVAALAQSGLAVTSEAVAAGLARAQWPARFQITGRLVIDGAHNPAGAAVLASAWRAAFPEELATLIFSAVESKDLRGVLQQILPLAKRVIVVPVRSLRAVSGEALAAAVVQENAGLPVSICATVPEALQTARQHPERILVAGSLYLCGEVLGELSAGSAFEPSLQ